MSMFIFKDDHYEISDLQKRKYFRPLFIYNKNTKPFTSFSWYSSKELACQDFPDCKILKWDEIEIEFFKGVLNE